MSRTEESMNQAQLITSKPEEDEEEESVMRLP